MRTTPPSLQCASYASCTAAVCRRMCRWRSGCGASCRRPVARSSSHIGRPALCLTPDGKAPGQRLAMPACWPLRAAASPVSELMSGRIPRYTGLCPHGIPVLRRGHSAPVLQALESRPCQSRSSCTLASSSNTSARKETVCQMGDLPEAAAAGVTWWLAAEAVLTERGSC